MLLDTPAPPIPTLLRRPGCWITFLTAVPIIAGGLYAIENWLGARDLARVKREVAAAGIEMNPHRLPSLRPPDAQNFFGTPLLLAVGNGATSGPEFTAMERHARWKDGNGYSAPGFQMESPSHPGPTDWARARDAIAAEDPLSGMIKGGPDPLGEIATILERDLTAVVAELEAALPRPHSVLVPTFDDQLRAGKSVDTFSADIGALRQLATALEFSVRTDLASGRHEPATTGIRILIRLAEGAEAYGTHMSALTGMDIRLKAATTTWVAAISPEGLPRQEWLGLAAAHRTGASLDRVSQALRGQMVYDDQAVRRLRTDPQQMAEYLTGFVTHGVMIRNRWMEWLVQFGPAGWIDFNTARMLEGEWQLCQRVGDSSNPTRFSGEKNRAWKQEWLESRSEILHGLMARKHLSLYVSSATSIARNAILSRLAETACALEAFRADHRVYPANLAALVPSYFPGVPDDLDGQPLRYAPDPDNGRYRIWSLGEDAVDDGGTERSQREGQPPRPWVEPVGDWVWQYPK